MALDFTTFVVCGGATIAASGPIIEASAVADAVIAGLEAATSGEIAIDGIDVTAERASDRGLAMVFQSYALYPHMSVKQNLSFGLENLKMPKAEIETYGSRVHPILRAGRKVVVFEDLYGNAWDLIEPAKDATA